MARIRTIKPEFFTSDEIGALAPLTRLAFIGLWCHADRLGRIEDRPARLKVLILPYDAVDFDAVLGELASQRHVLRYVVDGRKYIEITGFLKHQMPHYKEVASILPAPPDHPQLDVASTSTQCRVKVGSSSHAGREGKGTGREQEGNGTEGGVGGDASPPARLATGTRVPDRPLPDTWAQFAVTLGLDPSAVYAEFLDYWRGVPGQKGRKLDWDGTWRNRCRELAGRTRTGRPGEHPRTRGNVDAAKAFVARGQP